MCDGPLDHLTAADKHRLMERSVVRNLDRDDVIHLAGDPVDRVHLVEEGVVKLSLRDSEGEETILGLTTPGGWIGDIGAIDRKPQPLDAIAATNCVVRGVDAGLFVEIVFKEPAAAVALGRQQTQRTRWFIETALERTSGEVGARLAGRLLDLGHMMGRASDDDTITLDLPLGQRELGKLSGMCRESVCKTMRKMKRDGVLDYRGRTLRILKPDSLQMMRCGAGIS